MKYARMDVTYASLSEQFCKSQSHGHEMPKMYKKVKVQAVCVGGLKLIAQLYDLCYSYLDFWSSKIQRNIVILGGMMTNPCVEETFQSHNTLPKSISTCRLSYFLITHNGFLSILLVLFLLGFRRKHYLSRVKGISILYYQS